VHEAEDVVQTALARCYTAWDRVQRADDIDAYVYRTLLNTWAGSRRRRWWGELPTEDVPHQPGPDGVATSELRLTLSRALADLSPEHRQVLVLRYVADLSETQVAAALGLALGTVKSRVARAIARIDTEDLREASS
jgi:RNA polymerase sigma-70 factor (sigma-E family)